MATTVILGFMELEEAVTYRMAYGLAGDLAEGHEDVLAGRHRLNPAAGGPLEQTWPWSSADPSWQMSRAGNWCARRSTRWRSGGRSGAAPKADRPVPAGGPRHLPAGPARRGERPRPGFRWGGVAPCARRHTGHFLSRRSISDPKAPRSQGEPNRPGRQRPCSPRPLPGSGTEGECPRRRDPAIPGQGAERRLSPPVEDVPTVSTATDPPITPPPPRSLESRGAVVLPARPFTLDRHPAQPPPIPSPGRGTGKAPGLPQERPH